MDYYFLFLGIIYILGGVFWVGGSLMMTFFMVPPRVLQQRRTKNCRSPYE